MVIDVLVADLLKFVIVFYKICWPPEWCLSPFVIANMARRLSDKYLLISGRLWDILLSCGIGPYQLLWQSIQNLVHLAKELG